tara:strand:+ start:637 stop:1065 length:429 start_codon:yes stop_codon:yes gene_type:complete
MSNYKENVDNFDNVTVPNEEPPVTAEDQNDKFVGNSEEDSVDAEQILDGEQMKEYDDEVVTAVLLIKNKQNAVLPITKLDNLKMERQANAHEVMRMCADVQDQISAIRVVGELAQIFDNINKRSLKQVAELLSKKVEDDLGV